MNGRVARWFGVVPAAVIGLTALGAGPAIGQDDAGAPDGDQADTVALASETDVAVPPRFSTDVEIRVDVEQILMIDERNSFFEVDALLTAEWVDKRRPTPCTNQIHEGDRAAEVIKSDVWAPAFVVVDGRGPRQTTALELAVACNGDVRYEERFKVAVTQRLTELNNFPFDAHVIRFQIAPFGEMGRAAIRFRHLGEPCDLPDSPGLAAKLADKFEAEEWQFAARPCKLVEGPPSLTTSLRIDRESGYYVMNVIAPLVLIVMISWIVFWMRPALHERLGVSLTALLTVVAFDFLTSDGLPKLSFTTRLDQFYNVSYLFVALTIAASFLTTRNTSTRGRADDRGDAVGGGRGGGGRGGGRGRGDTVDAGGTSDAAAVETKSGVEHEEVGPVDWFSRRMFPPAYALALILVLWVGAFSPGRREITTEQESEDVAERAAEAVDAETVDVVDVGDDALVELAVGDVVGGEITETASPGESSTDRYSICVADDQWLAITLQRQADDGPFVPVPDLLTEQAAGAPVDFNDDWPDALEHSWVLPRAPGCYDVSVGDRDGGGTGSYRLSVDRVLTVGDVVDGEVVRGGPLERFLVCGSVDESVAITMRRDIEQAQMLDPELYLFTDEADSQDPAFVTSDDDGAGDLDSLLVLPRVDACYVLIAKDVTGEGIGAYTLRVELVDLVEQSEFAEVEAAFGRTFAELRSMAIDVQASEPVNQTIDETGGARAYRVCSQGEPGGYVLVQRPPVVIDDVFDPIAVLYTDDGSVVTEDDDGGGDRDSLVELPEGADCHVLVIADFARQETGKFVVTLRAGELPSPDELMAERSVASDLLFGHTFDEVRDVAGDLTLDGVERASIDAERSLIAHRVCAAREAGAAVEMRPAGDDAGRRLDPLLVLYTDDGSLHGFDDDSAGDLGSRIEIPAGEDCFVVVARDLTGAATGEFTLAFTE